LNLLSAIIPKKGEHATLSVVSFGLASWIEKKVMDDDGSVYSYTSQKQSDDWHEPQKKGGVQNVLLQLGSKSEWET
jgi:hypothetical protein